MNLFNLIMSSEILQMENLTIKIYDSGKVKPDQVITIPIAQKAIGL